MTLVTSVTHAYNLLLSLKKFIVHLQKLIDVGQAGEGNTYINFFSIKKQFLELLQMTFFVSIFSCNALAEIICDRYFATLKLDVHVFWFQISNFNIFFGEQVSNTFDYIINYF